MDLSSITVFNIITRYFKHAPFKINQYTVILNN